MTDFLHPTATYRLQFNANFKLSDAMALVDYFAELGISDIYASPILGSRKGSQHGYDVTDANHIDPDIGTAQEFANFQSELLKRGMRLLLDIVPNHMAASSENRWWMDVLENGYASRFASYFDIDWHPASKTLDGKVLLPVLGRPFGEALDRGELKLIFQDAKLFVQYFDATFPLAPVTYLRVLTHRQEELKKLLPEESPSYQEFSGIIASLTPGSGVALNVTETEAERRVRSDAIRERLQSLLASSPEVARFVDDNLADLNGRDGDPASRCLLEHLLREQHFRLAYWLDPNEGINYRRFFAISDLVGIRVEDPLVFEATHNHIFHLAATGAMRGVRVDHIDGLKDPVGYLNRLRERLVASLPAGSGDPWVLVEKILSNGETLPDDWQVSGTTGYEYLNVANGLFVSPEGARKIGAGYLDFIAKSMKFDDVAYEKKKLVMNTLLKVEMRSLGRQFADLAAGDRYARNLSRGELMDVLLEVTACLSIYRTYVRNLEVPAVAKQSIESAIADARRRQPRLSQECFAFLQDVLTLANPPHILSDQREERLAFVMRWQQFTSPIVAKGVEDTALYVYYPLLSLNEVGGSPAPEKVRSRDNFFEFIKARHAQWPDTLNATSTHDTKRSEDLRARLNVLSEVPDYWISNVKKWSLENDNKKKVVEGRRVPDANEEYLIYQTLQGVWPTNSDDLPAICKRLQAYMVKAIREAMLHTRWTEPNVPHETAITDFIKRILLEDADGAFLHDVAEFQKEIGYAGMVNGLGQTLLKIACPGVPDFYQGSEMWDYHLVDPDNRSPVDFEIRMRALKDLKGRSEIDPVSLVKDLCAGWADGRIKLYLIWKALEFRNSHTALFRDGEFAALEVVGEHADELVAFSRILEGSAAIVIIPRWTRSAPPGSDGSPSGDYWRNTRIVLPLKSPKKWQNVFTSSHMAAESSEQNQRLSVYGVLGEFPVALLSAMDGA